MARVGGETELTCSQFEKMMRGLRRNQKRHIWNKDLQQYEVKIESEAFKPMIESITRGLYWHIYGDRLPLDTKIRTARMRVGDWLTEFVADMGRYRSGGDQFLFACKRMDEHPTVSVWVFVFHRRVVEMAMTDDELSERLIAQAGVHGEPTAP
jgi:hypothetical protein